MMYSLGHGAFVDLGININEGMKWKTHNLQAIAARARPTLSDDSINTSGKIMEPTKQQFAECRGRARIIACPSVGEMVLTFRKLPDFEGRRCTDCEGQPLAVDLRRLIAYPHKKSFSDSTDGVEFPSTRELKEHTQLLLTSRNDPTGKLCLSSDHSRRKGSRNS